MKKQFILEARNSGKLFGANILKIELDDEKLSGNDTVKCQVLLSDYKKLDIKKGDKVKVTIEKI